MESEYINNALLFGATHVVSALALTTAHYFPWLPNRGELDRVTAYAIGTAVVVGMPVVTMMLAYLTGNHRSELFWVALLLINTLVCGATVRLAYWIDDQRIKPISLDEARSERR